MGATAEQRRRRTAATAPLSRANVKISSSMDALVELTSHDTRAIQGVPPLRKAHDRIKVPYIAETSVALTGIVDQLVLRKVY